MSNPLISDTLDSEPTVRATIARLSILRQSTDPAESEFARDNLINILRLVMAAIAGNRVYASGEINLFAGDQKEVA